MDYTTRDTLGVHELQPSLFPGSSHGVRLDPDEARSEGSSDDVHFRELRPFYETERLNNNLQVCGHISWIIMFNKHTRIQISACNTIISRFYGVF